MKGTRDTRDPREVTRDRYDSTARLLKLIASYVDAKLTNTRPALNVRHDWTDVADATRIMDDVWAIAMVLYLDDADGDEETARAMAMQAAFDTTPSPLVRCGTCRRFNCTCGRKAREAREQARNGA